MDKLDLKKQWPSCYKAKREVQFVEVPSLTYICYEGKGNPGTSLDFQEAMGVLYGLAYTIKFMCKEEDKDFTVILWKNDKGVLEKGFSSPLSRSTMENGGEDDFHGKSPKLPDRMHPPDRGVIMQSEDTAFIEKLTSQMKWIYSLSFRFCADAHKAEDLAQQTLLTAWEKRSQLQNPDKIGGWLRQICLNHYLSTQRKAGTEVQPEGEWQEEWPDIRPLPEEDLVVEESVRELQDGCFTAMASRLTLPQRSAFILVDMLGLSIDETAVSLELSGSSVKSLLFRARKNMNAFFGHHCQWVLPENSCRCKAWQEFALHRETLRAEVRKHGGPPDFADPRYSGKSDPATMQRVITLFRNLPLRKPDPEWYERTARFVGDLLR